MDEYKKNKEKKIEYTTYLVKKFHIFFENFVPLQNAPINRRKFKTEKNLAN